MNIITGEKVQQLCDIYLGFKEDFYYNPVIRTQINKHHEINSLNLNTEFDNPYYIFCYSHRIQDLSSKVHLFKNKFVLVTHNSDCEVKNDPYVLNILNTPNLDKWYAQNMCFTHSKLCFLPIGIANSMWPHGNLNAFNNHVVLYNTNHKTKNVYFNFKIDTNREKRNACLNSLKSRLEWLNNVSPSENILRLSQYKFCVCPEGNGVDTHRLWEALYLKTIPIVIKSEFTDILKQNNVPLIILNSWDDFDENNLHYDSYNLENVDLNRFLNI